MPKPKDENFGYNCAEEVATVGGSEKYPKKVTIGNWGKGSNKADFRTWQSYKGGPLTAGKGIAFDAEELQKMIDDKVLEKALEALSKHSPKE